MSAETVSVIGVSLVFESTFGVKPPWFSLGAGATTRSNCSTSQSRPRAWVGVRPFSIRASTGAVEEFVADVERGYKLPLS